MEHLMGVLTGIGFVLFLFGLSGIKIKLLTNEPVSRYYKISAIGAFICFLIVFIHHLILKYA